MKKHTIMMIDYRAEGFGRYAITIAEEMKRKQSVYLIGCAFSPNINHVSYDVFNDFIAASDYGYDAEIILKKYQPDAIILFAHRIFDYMFTVKAHQLGITVYNFQHGMYMRHTVISDVNAKSIKGIFMTKRNKLIQYLFCIKRMMNNNMLDTATALLNLTRAENLYVFMNDRFGATCNADVSFVFGDYWIQYYLDQYKEKNTEFYVVGYPELENAAISINERIHFPNELPVVCYLAQTAVEDGTVSNSTFKSFIEALNNCICDFNLVIKLHPRSNITLYDTLSTGKNGKHVAIWREKEFPISNYYLGHDSTVLARALHYSPKTMVCLLTERGENPFVKYTKYVVSNANNLQNEMKRMLAERDSDYAGTAAIEEFSLLNKNHGALAETADIIITKQIFNPAK